MPVKQTNKQNQPNKKSQKNHKQTNKRPSHQKPKHLDLNPTNLDLN